MIHITIFSANELCKWMNSFERNQLNFITALGVHVEKTVMLCNVQNNIIWKSQVTLNYALMKYCLQLVFVASLIHYIYAINH